MIYFPETIIQWIRYYWEYLHTFSSKLCTLTHTVHARVLKPWRGRLPSVFSSCHVLSPPLSGLNWRSPTPLGGPGPFTSKMASLSTGSAHTPSPRFRTTLKVHYYICVRRTVGIKPRVGPAAVQLPLFFLLLMSKLNHFAYCISDTFLVRMFL